MTTTSPGGQPLRTLLLTLAGMVICATASGAGRDRFEIELKELRPAPASATAAGRDAFDLELKDLRPAPGRRETTPRQTRPAKSVPAESTAGAGRDSSYTVRPGDNLFLILIRHYGLSNSAAEQLIPEIVRRNNISDPLKLTVGQRLIIPLASKSRPSAVKPAASTLPAARPAEAAPLPETPRVREIVLDAAPPCHLARSVARELGLLIPPLSAMTRPENVSVGFDGLKLDVACDLSPAVAYTHERLLSPHGIQLLLFNGAVPPRQVLEELADRLGLTFWLADEQSSDELPVTYLFPAADPGEKDVRLTIRPAPTPSPASP